MARRCCHCGDTQDLHRYGEASVYSRNPGAPIYACRHCDPPASDIVLAAKRIWPNDPDKVREIAGRYGLDENGAQKT